MAYNNLYHEVANPLFEAGGVDYRRGVLPSDPDGYLPDDLVIPYESAHRLANDEPLTSRDVRSALWLCAGNIRRAPNVSAFLAPEFARSLRIRRGFNRNSLRPASASWIERKPS